MFNSSRTQGIITRERYLYLIGSLAQGIITRRHYFSLIIGQTEGMNFSLIVG